MLVDGGPVVKHNRARSLLGVASRGHRSERRLLRSGPRSDPVGPDTDLTPRITTRALRRSWADASTPAQLNTEPRLLPRKPRAVSCATISAIRASARSVNASQPAWRRGSVTWATASSRSWTPTLLRAAGRLLPNVAGSPGATGTHASTY
jgi:hypothetical protein